MTAGQFVEAIRRRPIVHAPFGLLEWHGEHLPLGFDGLKARALCERIAARCGGIVLPATWTSCGGFGTYAGTLVFAEALVKRLIVELLGQLEKVGARVVVLLTGHYGDVQVETVKKAAATFTPRQPMRIIAQPEYEGVRLADGSRPADHAGKWETSLGLALLPHLVRLDRFRPGECPIERYDARYALERYRTREVEPWRWSADVAREASVKIGREVVERIVAVVGAKIEEACRDLGLPVSP